MLAIPNIFVTPQHSRKNGFTLIEMAVVLLVVTLLLGGLLVPLSTQIQQRKVSETQQMLDDIKEALIGYAASHVDASNHPYLPCPDVTNDGVEDRYTTGPNAGKCNASRGNLPWVTLGTASADSWGNRFRYQAALDFANSNAGFTLGISGNIKISTRDSDKNPLSLATDIPALVMSFGPNGYGAMHENNNAQAAPPAQNSDETTNTAPLANPGYLSRTPSALQPAIACSDIKPGQPFCEFDDMITWLSPNILFNRMIAAGRLP